LGQPEPCKTRGRVGALGQKGFGEFSYIGSACCVRFRRKFTDWNASRFERDRGCFRVTRCAPAAVAARVSNGHSVKMVIFDDSSLANHEKYYSKLEKTRTVNDLYYVGPQEKEQFLKFLNRKLRDRKLESLVRTIFRPSYGGNRNFSLIYTLGAFLVSADDDMRPYALVESSPESLKPEEVSRGRLKKPGENGYIDKSFDILTSFKDVLGKKVSELPGNFESGNLLVDTSMDLETNVTKEFATENSLLLEDGPVSKNAVVKIAQSFRTGTNDIDALDYVEMYLHDEEQRQKDLHEINEVYVLENFRPVVTNKNWRIDCGVAG